MSYASLSGPWGGYKFPRDSFPRSNRNRVAFFLNHSLKTLCCFGRTLGQLHLLSHFAVNEWLSIFVSFYLFDLFWKLERGNLLIRDGDELYRPVMICEHDRNSLWTSKGLSFYVAVTPNFWRQNWTDSVIDRHWLFYRVLYGIIVFF